MSNELPDTFEELLISLSKTPLEVSRLVSGLPLESLRQKEEDQFSPLENVCHLRDIEIDGYTVRIRKILNEEHPALADIDGTQLAILRDYNSQEVGDALEAFAQARKENVDVLSEVDDAQLRRTGLLEGVGETSLGGLLRMMWEHDAGHLDELRRIRRP